MGDRLPKAPLKEVSLEVRWGIGKKEPAPITSMDAILGLGKFVWLIQPDFPRYSAKKYDGLLPPYEVAFQFSEGEGHWPIVQYGPGIVTVNDNHAQYDWTGRYLPLVKTVLIRLMSAHAELGGIVFTQSTLKYVDAVKLSEYGGKRSEIEKFLNKKFNFAIESKVKGTSIVNMKTLFEIKIGKELIYVSLGTGTLEGEDAFIWETYVTLMHEASTLEQVIASANEAHDLLSIFFKEFCSQAFVNEFRQHL